MSVEKPVFELSSSYQEGQYSGNYTIKVWDDEVKQITGKSWNELTEEQQNELKQSYLNN